MYLVSMIVCKKNCNVLPHSNRNGQIIEGLRNNITEKGQEYERSKETMQSNQKWNTVRENNEDFSNNR